MRDELDPQLRNAIEGLRDTSPARDLWPDIRARLTPRLPRGTVLLRWPAALAAGIALVFAASGSTYVLLHHGAGAASPHVTAATPAATPLVSAAYAPADAALFQAIAQLERTVRTNLATARPAVRASVDSSIAALNRAIADAATRQTAMPDDPRAAQLLTSTLRKKLDVLHTVSRLTTRQD